MLLLIHSGSVQSQREVRWYVLPVPLSQGKQSMASRSTWRFARRFVGVTEWVHRNKKTTLCSQRFNVLCSACLCINIKMLFRIRFHIGNICQTYSIKVSTASGSLSTELKFPPWFIVLTAVLLDTSLTGAHCTLSGAFTAILLISRQKNNNPGPVISVFPLTVYNMLLLNLPGLTSQLSLKIKEMNFLHWQGFFTLQLIMDSNSINERDMDESLL